MLEFAGTQTGKRVQLLSKLYSWKLRA